MANVAIQTSVEVPAGLLIYDIGAEGLICNFCGGVAAFPIIGREPTRGGEPTVEAAFRQFVVAHYLCALRTIERQNDNSHRVLRGGPNDR